MENNQSSIGSIIGTIIIIALIILGGLYFWGKRIEEQKATQAAMVGSAEQTIVVDNSEAMQIKKTSSADDLTSINADLQNTKTTGLAPEVGQ